MVISLYAVALKRTSFLLSVQSFFFSVSKKFMAARQDYIHFYDLFVELMTLLEMPL